MIWGRIRVRLAERFAGKWRSNPADCNHAVDFIADYLAEHPDATKHEIERAANRTLDPITLAILSLILTVAWELWKKLK